MQLPDVIILTGGRGTRVSHLYPDIPKPMIRFKNRPFLEWLILWLEIQGIRRIILSLGYKKQIVKGHIESIPFQERGIEIVYCEEDSPLGTGGAFAQASNCVLSDQVCLMNGDSICLISLVDFVDDHCKSKSPISLVGVHVANAARFGNIVCHQRQVERFLEKQGIAKQGLVNAGIYCMDTHLLKKVEVKQQSIERDLFPIWLDKYSMLCHETRAEFIDIGTPESLKEAGCFLQRNYTKFLKDK